MTKEQIDALKNEHEDAQGEWEEMQECGDLEDQLLAAIRLENAEAELRRLLTEETKP